MIVSSVDKKKNCCLLKAKIILKRFIILNQDTEFYLIFDNKKTTALIK